MSERCRSPPRDKPCKNKDCKRKLEEAEKEIERLRKELEECRKAAAEAALQCEREKEELREKIKELEANQGNNCCCCGGGGGGSVDGSWVSAKDGEVPAGAVEGGFDPKEKFYVARAPIEDHLLPGKLHPSMKSCWVPFGDTELRKNVYEVLVEEGCSWVAMTSSQALPPKAVVGGYKVKDGEKETLYIGRASIDIRLVPGYVFSSSKELLHSHNYINETKTTYEILVKK